MDTTPSSTLTSSRRERGNEQLVAQRPRARVRLVGGVERGAHRVGDHDPVGGAGRILGAQPGQRDPAQVGVGQARVDPLGQRGQPRGQGRDRRRSGTPRPRATRARRVRSASPTTTPTAPATIWFWCAAPRRRWPATPCAAARAISVSGVLRAAVSNMARSVLAPDATRDSTISRQSVTSAAASQPPTARVSAMMTTPRHHDRTGHRQKSASDQAEQRSRSITEGQPGLDCGRMENLAIRSRALCAVGCWQSTS